MPRNILYKITFREGSIGKAIINEGAEEFITCEAKGGGDYIPHEKGILFEDGDIMIYDVGNCIESFTASGKVVYAAVQPKTTVQIQRTIHGRE